MARFFGLFFLCLPLLASHAQTRDTIFADEGYVLINRGKFESKLRSKLYYDLEYDLDTVILKKLFLRYYLGQLDSLKKQQLYGILAQRNKVDTTQTMVIHYLDTLKRRDSYPRKEYVVSLKNGGHRHIPSYNTFLKAHKHCMKTYRKQEGIKVYHYYHYNEGHPTAYKGLQWNEDPLDVLRKLFYNESDNTVMWRVFLHPNGDYFVLYGSMPNNMYEDLKFHKNWDTHYRDFWESYNRVNGGIFD